MLTIKETLMSKRKTGALRKETRNYRRNEEFNSYNSHYSNDSKTIDFNQTQPKRVKKAIELVPQSRNQEKYIVALTDPETDVVIVSGPAGTGKSYLATLNAIRAFRNREVDRIVLCRPKVSIEDEDHGFLPGDLISKMAPWVKPITDILREFYSMKEIEYMLSEEIIEFAPLGFIRGRTFKNSMVIIDEAQNCSISQIQSALTRIGEGSKFVLNGDIAQTDRQAGENGFIDIINKLKATPVKGIEVCEFAKHDIQRHPIIGEILKLYK